MTNLDLSKLKAGGIVRVRLDADDVRNLTNYDMRCKTVITSSQILSAEPAPIEKTEVQRWLEKLFQGLSFIAICKQHFITFTNFCLSPIIPNSVPKIRLTKSCYRTPNSFILKTNKVKHRRFQGLWLISELGRRTPFASCRNWPCFWRFETARL